MSHVTATSLLTLKTFGVVPAPITFATVSPTIVGTQPPSAAAKKEQDGHISSTTMTQNQRRIMHNSFDIMNPLVIDETAPTEQKKYKQPPMVFRSGECFFTNSGRGAWR